MKPALLKPMIAAAAFLFLISCQGGGDGSAFLDPIFGSQAPLEQLPYIYAELDSFPAGSTLADVQNATVHVLDTATGIPISDAVVEMQGVRLTYSAVTQGYAGHVVAAPGDTVTLTVSAGGKTYEASGSQFTSYPAIVAPATGTRWSTSAVNTVTWSGGTPVAESFYGLGVVDADNATGRLVWPSGNYLEEVPADTISYSIPADCLTVGNRLVAVGIAKSASVPGADPESRFIVSGFDIVPITVYDDSGTQWTKRQAAWTTNDLNDVVWSGTQFAAVGGIGSFGAILTSPDGITWTQRMTSSTSTLTGVVWSGTQFVAVGSLGAIFTSANGMAWTSRSSGTTDYLSGVVWSGTQYVAVGSSYDNSRDYSNYATILTSPDGVTWTRRASIPNCVLRRVAWSGAQYVAVGWLWSGSSVSNFIFTSPDGVVWTSRPPGLAARLNGVVWGGSQFVIAGAGSVLTSPDGVAWTLRSAGTEILNSVTWSGTNYVAVGMNGAILISRDGVSWTPHHWDFIFPSDLFSVVWSGTRYVVGGEGGTLLTSP